MPEQTLNAFLTRELSANPGLCRLVLGFSGGLDSSVLLHALARTAPVFSLPVLAVHVHHGLSPNADAWAEHAQIVCDQIDIPLQVFRVQVSPQGSVEAAAREARRAAFASVLQSGDALLLAQHQDDQAETVLFRLLRGSGVRGLSAMAGRSRFPLADGSSVPQWRPFLSMSRASLEDWAQQQSLQWIEDESNTDTRYTRNFLRQDVFPLLQTRWPALKERLAATALRLQEADSLLDELAAELAAGVLQGHCLDIAALTALALPKQRLVLRFWLRQEKFSLPDEALLQRILDEVVAAREDATPLLAWQGAEVRRYRERLYVMRPLLPIVEDWQQDWDGKSALFLPDGRKLIMHSPLQLVRVSYRQGGERLRPAGQAQSRELRTLFQENSVPPWERERLPLIWRDHELLAVAGLDWARAAMAPDIVFSD